MNTHHYKATIIWTGNLGQGTSTYRAYDRSHTVNVDGKPVIPASSDPAFRGDKSKYNPEELFVASISSCHLLWYLHLCAEAGVVVVDYSDNATGTMLETPDRGGRFTEVTLHPNVIVSDSSMIDKANELHHNVNKMCFKANSCNFPVHHQPTCSVRDGELKKL
jgi:organic hydroperoxide reductase OsmC/OhrA